jgi:branched-chain amino acid transport system ATP-binding protein
MTADPLLVVERLSKRFGRLTVVAEVSFTVAPGEALGVIGPNGAGKSTLLNLVSGVLAADAGTVRFAGADITRTSADRRCRAGIGRSYQIPRPFSGMTVFENALVAASFGAGRRGRAAHELAAAALERIGLAAFANRPAGSLRLLDRKRLELARALASDPRVVLLDEIAGGLSEHELPQLIDTVRDVRASGVAVVWIEHVVHALLAVADRLMCLTYGRMLALGPPAEVLAAPEVRQTYLGVEPDPAGDAA